MRSLTLSLFALVVVACGDDGGSTTPVDAAKADSAVVDAPDVDIDAPVDAGDDPRGPKTITLTGGANSVFWDAAASTLYLTDNNANTLLKYTDAGGIATVGTWPTTTAGVSLGDMIKRNNGGILITNFGFGTEGNLFLMNGNQATALTGLDATRRRIGLASDGAGTTYVGYFTPAGMGVQNGGVATVAIAQQTVATETEVAGVSTTAGFKKVVGIAATPTAVFVADQTDKKIYKLAVPGFAVTTVGTVPSADLLTVLPNGDLLTGGTGVHRLTQAGVATTETIPGLTEQVRGIAYDPALQRLFLVEHSATVGVPDKLHVVPFAP